MYVFLEHNSYHAIYTAGCIYPADVCNHRMQSAYVVPNHTLYIQAQFYDCSIRSSIRVRMAEITGD